MIKCVNECVFAFLPTTNPEKLTKSFLVKLLKKSTFVEYFLIKTYNRGYIR